MLQIIEFCARFLALTTFESAGVIDSVKTIPPTDQNHEDRHANDNRVLHGLSKPEVTCIRSFKNSAPNQYGAAGLTRAYQAPRSTGRGVGWEYVHVCINDHTRVTFAKVIPDEKKSLSIVTSLRALVPFNASEGLFDGRGQRVVIDVEDEDSEQLFRLGLARVASTLILRRVPLIS